MAWKRDASPLLFFGAMALLPALGMPATPFFVLAGTTFGVKVGLVGTAAALTSNVAIVYWIGRSGMRTVLERLLRRFGYDLPDFDHSGKGAARFTLAIKLAPALPSALKNYVLGMVGVPFLLYFGLSMLISGSYAATLVVLGESLMEHDLGTAAVVVGALLVLGLAIWWWQKKHRDGKTAS
jgi:uncharacterized membrane protein YdjX (TVP38/TMEM64 family)